MVLRKRHKQGLILPQLWFNIEAKLIWVQCFLELVGFSFALSAASMYRQNAQTLPSLPLKAKAWYKTVTSLSFDCKGLFTSPYQDSIYSIFVLTLFCNAKNWRIEKNKTKKKSPHWYGWTRLPGKNKNIKPCWFRITRDCWSPGKQSVPLLLLQLRDSRIYRSIYMWLYVE